MKLFSFTQPFLVNVINFDKTFAELVNSMSGIYDLQGNCKLKVTLRASSPHRYELVLYNQWVRC